MTKLFASKIAIRISVLIKSVVVRVCRWNDEFIASTKVNVTMRTCLRRRLPQRCRLTDIYSRHDVMLKVASSWTLWHLHAETSSREADAAESKYVRYFRQCLPLTVSIRMLIRDDLDERNIIGNSLVWEVAESANSVALSRIKIKDPRTEPCVEHVNLS